MELHEAGADADDAAAVDTEGDRPLLLELRRGTVEVVLAPGDVGGAGEVEGVQRLGRLVLAVVPALEAVDPPAGGVGPAVVVVRPRVDPVDELARLRRPQF